MKACCATAKVASAVVTEAMSLGAVKSPGEMGADIVAMQELYGLSTTTRTGNTTYGFNSTADRPAFDFTLNADPVIAIGYPLGLDQTTTSGIISGVGRQIQAQNNFSIDKVIQTDAPINPGNSGGPLLDLSGAVVGMNVRTVVGVQGGGGVSLSIPIEVVQQIARENQSDALDRPRLGARFEDVSPPAAAAASGLSSTPIAIRNVPVSTVRCSALGW